MSGRRTSNPDGKCGSFRFFTPEQGKECTGLCPGRMNQKGRLERSYKCKGYEKAPTVILASEEGSA